MRIITIFEHATLTQADFANANDFDWLIEQNFAVFHIERKNAQWQLKARQYIGMIGLPSGWQLEILPKITQHADIDQTRQWVQNMLTEIWQRLIPKNLSNVAKQTPINMHMPLNDWLKEQFWQRFTSYQPNQQYQRFEHNQPFLQGKLLVKQQLQHNQHQPHKFFHQTDKLALDTAGNRLVKTAMSLLGVQPLISHDWQGVAMLSPTAVQPTFRHAQQELQALPQMIAEQNLAFISFCYTLLTLWQASGQGQRHTQALLINMQFAFEKWVTYRLTQQFSQHNAKIIEQCSQPLTANAELTIKPDLVIKTDGFIQVIDIKWKNIQSVSDIRLADMYQILTYADQFNADEAWLVVPTLDKALLKQPIVLHKPSQTQFYLVPFLLF